ncbi:hypothetical protein [Flavobacterium chryseum]|uniref:hypothetical protein n=1 Tax=Flavobacterium sp. P3160 TaxID=2512113 RepID=UPI001414F952|nr:hypothetical protein [Flavobacterium sp. P3160]
MKKKIIFINFLMSLTVLFSMLFQTVHSYEHVYKQLTEKHCDHKYSAHHKQITHAHSVENNCPVCHFTFSTFIPNAFHSLSFQNVNVVSTPVFFYKTAASTFFKGSLFALRAPPVLS